MEQSITIFNWNINTAIMIICVNKNSRAYMSSTDNQICTVFFLLPSMHLNCQTRTNHAFTDAPEECLQRLKKTKNTEQLKKAQSYPMETKKKVHGDAHSMCTKQGKSKPFYWLVKKLNQPQGSFEYRKQRSIFSPAWGASND